MHQTQHSLLIGQEKPILASPRHELHPRVGLSYVWLKSHRKLAIGSTSLLWIRGLEKRRNRRSSLCQIARGGLWGNQTERDRAASWQSNSQQNLNACHTFTPYAAIQDHKLLRVPGFMERKKRAPISYLGRAPAKRPSSCHKNGQKINNYLIIYWIDCQADTPARHPVLLRCGLRHSEMPGIRLSRSTFEKFPASKLTELIPKILYALQSITK